MPVFSFFFFCFLIAALILTLATLVTRNEKLTWLNKES